MTPPSARLDVARVLANAGSGIGLLALSGSVASESAHALEPRSIEPVVQSNTGRLPPLANSGRCTGSCPPSQRRGCGVQRESFGALEYRKSEFRSSGRVVSGRATARRSDDAVTVDVAGGRVTTEVVAGVARDHQVLLTELRPSETNGLEQLFFSLTAAKAAPPQEAAA